MLKVHRIGCLAIAASAMLLLPKVSRAEKTDPSMIPPDVTYSTTPQAVPTSVGASGSASGGASVPGLAGGVQAVVPGMAGAGQNVPPPVTPGMGPPGSMMHASSGMTMNGFAIPQSGKITASMMKPPGTKFGLDGQPQSPQQSNGLYQGSGTPVDPNAPDPIVTITTSRGPIQMRLFRSKAPISVDNFLDLINRGFYNGKKFHRYVEGFCIQGGCPNGTGTGIFIDPDTHVPRMLPLEISPDLKHNAAGVVAMARMQSPNSGSCQFYITLGPQPSLDGKYTVFGGVLSGMNVVQSLRQGDTIVSATVGAR